jgi:nucleoside-diphosphate-sugar epimerase
MRVLVTGASGLLGRAVIDGLAERGASVVAFSRTPPPDLPPAVRFVAGDIRDRDAVQAVMAGCDVVAHFAWVVRPLRSAADTDAINVGGTANVIDAMEAAGCGRLVFSSSVLAYGARKDNPARLREDAPLRPNPGLLYSEHKAAAEQLIAERGVPAAITRSSMIVGRRVGNYGLDLGALPVLVRLGDGPMRLQMLHQDDAARFHVEACFGARTGPVNLASEDVIEVDEAAQIAGKRLVDLPPRLVDTALDASWRLGVSDIDPTSKTALAYWPVVDCTALTERWGFTCAWDTRAALRDFARATSRTVFLGNRVVEPPWRFPLGLADPPPARTEGVDAGVSPLGLDVLDRAYAASRAVLGAEIDSAHLRSLFGERALLAATGHRAAAASRLDDPPPFGPRTRMRAAGLGREMRLLERDARNAALPDDALPSLTDEQLRARLDLLADLFAHSASVLVVAEAQAAHHGPLGAGAEAAALAVGTARLGRELDGRLALDQVLGLDGAEVVEAVRSCGPSAVGQLQRLLAESAAWRLDPVDLASPLLDDPRFLVAAALRSAGCRLPSDVATGRGRRAVSRRFALRRILERFALGLRAAALERGRRLATAGVLEEPGSVFGLTVSQATAAVPVAPAAGAAWVPPTGPDLAALAADRPLVLTATNVTLPLTPLLPAVVAVVSHADTPWCDGASAATSLGVPFSLLAAPGDALRGQHVTLGVRARPE